MARHYVCSKNTIISFEYVDFWLIIDLILYPLLGNLKTKITTTKNIMVCSFYLYFQGLPVFIEEGRYKDIETFNIPTSPQSIRLVKDDMGSPELYLASSTNYQGM